MKVRKSLWEVALATTFLALLAAGTARADVAAERLEAIAGATSAFGLCAGQGMIGTADVHPSPGDEILTVRKRLILRSDTDQDDNRVLTHVVSVIVKSSSTKQTLYETAPPGWC